MIDSSNLTRYVLEKYGRKRQDLSIVIPMIIIYIIIFITGVFGNVATCLIIAKNRYMQTPTNAYLFNLAVADLIVLILGLPHEICITWQTYPDIFGGIFCVARALIAETSTYASILTITAFTAERYVAICHPMWSHTMSKIKRAIKIIIIIWFVSLVCAAPLASQFGIKNLKWNITGEEIDGTEICDVVRPLERVFEISSFLFFFTPMTVIGALYALIGWTIRKSTINRTGSDVSDQSGHPTDFRTQQQSRARRAVLKMLVAVVVAFFVCWAPFHTQRLLTTYAPEKERQKEPLQSVLRVLFYVSGILYYVSSVINPILYNIMSIKFRQAFLHTLFKPCRRPQNRVTKTRLAKAAYQFAGRPLLPHTKTTAMNGTSRKMTSRHAQLHLRRHLEDVVPSTSSVKSNSNKEEFELLARDIILTDFKSAPCSSAVVVSSNRPFHSYA